MGYLKARMSVKEGELVYLGCLVAVLLAFPLRPVDDTDMFRCADPAASLLDPLMSDMIFVIANDSNSTENSSPLNEVVIGNQKLRPDSRQITGNGTTKLFLTYKRGKSGPSRGSTLLENNLPRALDSTLPNHSSAMFLYVFSLSPGSKFCMSCYSSMGKGEKDVCHGYRPCFRSWYSEVTSPVCEGTTLERFLNTSNVEVEDNEEHDKEVMDLFSTMNLNITSIQYRETEKRGSDLSNIVVIPEYGLIGTDTSFSHDFNNFIKLITQIKKKNKFHIPMMLGVIGGIIMGSIISILSRKYLKYLTGLGSDYESSEIFNPFRASLLDESYLLDRDLYERLLEEAILVSSGSSGKVYKIKFLEHECAMKVFFSHARIDFRREAVIVASFDHPNIIKFFCCFRKSFIIMELLDEDLYSFIKKVREKTSDYELSLEVALDVMLQIAEGMSYLHGEGIAHQDLKSLNILLKLQGEPHSSNFRIIAKIADFGCARSFDPRHPRGFFLRPKENIGTRSWRAPELFPPRGGFLTKVFGMACEILPKPLDIYGFAIICSELLTKQIPYSSTNEPRNVHGVELRAGLRPSLPSHGCPEELITLIEDCWHTNPQSRPEFDEICVRLRRLIEVQSHGQAPSTL